MTEKELFITQIKDRTKALAIMAIRLVELLPSNKTAAVITYQLVKSATSVGANYRAACRARSKAEFYSKISITIEETDETLYWLEIIDEAKLIRNNLGVEQLKNECLELLKIFSKARKNTKS